MKQKGILFLLLVSCVLGVLGILRYREYLDFLDLYQQGAYTQILENRSSESPQMLHNYGLTAFERFMSGGMTQVDDLREANLLFSGSLQQQEHEKTRFQYEFTKSLLDMLSDSGEQENDDESAQNQDGQDGESGEENQDGSSQDSQDGASSSTQNSRESQYFLSQGEEIQPLSPSEQRALEESIQELKNDQMRNQKFYGKQQQTTPFQEAFDSIFGPLDRGGEKDW